MQRQAESRTASPGCPRLSNLHQFAVPSMYRFRPAKIRDLVREQRTATAKGTWSPREHNGGRCTCQPIGDRWELDRHHPMGSAADRAIAQVVAGPLAGRGQGNLTRAARSD